MEILPLDIQMEILPLDIQRVLVETIYGVCGISFVMMSYVNKSYYRIVTIYAYTKRIKRRVQTSDVAYRGYLGILKWIRYSVPGWNSFLYNVGTQVGLARVFNVIIPSEYEWNSVTCSSAAAGGHLEVLIWLRSEGCGWDSMTTFWAAENGHLTVLKWACSNGCEITVLTESLAKKKWPEEFS